MSTNGPVVTPNPVEILKTTRHYQSNRTSEKVRLDGNIARRKIRGREFFWWDTELPGFGLRVFAGGSRSWFVQFRQRGKQMRITLGRPPEVRAEEARTLARAQLAKVMLDGLPVSQKARRDNPGATLFRDFALRFWADYSRHWKPSTRKGNRARIFKDLTDIFGHLRVDAIRKADVLRWRDSWADRSGAFNRTIPIMSVMMGYAEQLGMRPRGSNPCRGTPRYKRKLVDRFLSAREFNRLAGSLRNFEESNPIAVQAIRLLIYTGARHGEVVGLRWEWVQPPRLMLPDSKTGAKIVYLNRQAQAVLDAMPNKADTGLVFSSLRGDKPIALSPIWHEIRRHAALPDVRLHDLRHSFASIAIADGISLVVIGKLLGHALAETTERYAHLADEAIADAAKRISGSLARHLGLAA
ncbi:MAG: tyrosine-type recombinase/integrase [Erythrobacter sp.]|jgi:integrase|uniref:Integrase n=1 Tax=Sphingopyxis macrogoltabida TaxID=33050 RepID=A0A0N9UYI1_SPHMC|nr:MULTISPECIES: site-specific integrase [Sphingomonadales]ALH81311.1 integrase [Sphingopyxis macrogoltabida]WRH69411.1 MAG: tyrosine-type recombinase/integrase [Erythrobacter sp.]